MKKFSTASCALALGIGLVSSTPLVFAQQLASDQVLEKIEITGSLIKRIEGETALPVTVVTKEDIQRSGATSVEQLMMYIPAIASAGNTTVAQAAGATTGSLSAISLRGLTSVRTLVLINGRRVTPYGNFADTTSVDVNSIPIAAIERIDILKEGASATYGSDAIAGVVNFILRENFKGVEATAEYGDSTRGGGATETATLAYGYGELAKDRYNVMVTGSFNKENELWGYNRAFAASGLLNSNYDNTSRHTFPGNITPQTGPLTGLRLNPGYPNGCNSSATVPTIADPNFQVLPTYSQCRADVSPLVPLIPQQEHDSLFASFHYALTKDLTAFAEVSYNRNKTDQLEQPSPVSNALALSTGNKLITPSGIAANCVGNQCIGTTGQIYGGPFNALSTILLAPTGPTSVYYPFAYMAGAYNAFGYAAPTSAAAFPVLNVAYRTNFNGGRGLEDTTQTPRLVLGIKGMQFGWDVDTAVVHATNQVTEKTTGGYFIQSQLLPILNGNNTTVGPINVLYPAIGPAPSAAQIAAMQATNFNGTAWVNKTGIDDLTVRGSRDIGKLAGGALSLGVGAEVRHEKYESDPNAYLGTGDISGYGGNSLPVTQGRTMYAAFAEVDAPLTKELEADGSIRIDHYQIVGSKMTPKLSLRYQPSQMFLLRGSYGKGFRAPSLADLYAPQIQGLTAVLNNPGDCVNKVGQGCDAQYPTTAGGNPKLKPETSNNASWGVVFEPTKNISASIDFFNIEIKNVIANGGLDPIFIFSHLSTWGSLVSYGAHDPALLGVPGALLVTSVNQENINLGSERVSGFDLDYKQLIPTATSGKFTLVMHGTYFSKYQTRNPDGSYTDQIDTASQTLSNGGVIPRWKHRAEIDWQKGDWDTLLAQNWQGSYVDTGGTTVGTWETYDLNIGYTGFKDWRLNLGAKNVLDKDPPFTGAAGSLWFQAGYDPAYADPRGRFVYLSVGYKFK